MHWAIDAVVEATPSNGHPKALRNPGPSHYSKSLPGTAGKVFSYFQEMAFSGAPNGGTSKYSSQAAVGLCGPFLTFRKSAFFSLL